MAKVMGILKSHEKEITSEAKTTTSLGSLALVAKGKKAIDDDSESDIFDEELTREDKALMVSNPKKISRKTSPDLRTEVVREVSILKSQRRTLKESQRLRMRRSWLVTQEDNEYDAVEVWSTDYDDEEVRKPTHGRRFMVEECDAVVNKVHSVLNSLSICSSSYDKELDDLRISLKNEERMMKINALELELFRVRDNVIYVQRDNLLLIKQHNIFCLIAKRLYNNITQLHLDCDIGRGLHKMILPFLELKEDEIDAECYRCETIVSSDDLSEAYRIGLDKIENYIQSKEHKSMVKEFFSENNREEMKTATLKKFHSLNSKLNSEDILNTENGSQALNEQATVFPKIQTVPNQVFIKQGLNSKDVIELKVLVDNDNSDDCDAFFWSAPIDNLDETKGLSEMTSWKSRGKYISGSLNRKDSFSQPGTSGTKPFRNSIPIPKPQPSSSIKQTLPKSHNSEKKVEIPKTSETSKKNPSNPTLKSNDLKRKAKLYPKPQQKPTLIDTKFSKAQKNVTLGNAHSFHSVIRDEQYDLEWYIDSGYSRHMTGRREELREYRSLRNEGKIRYGNNAT
ncbi:hypothetical protein L2E82_44670 [Cichorium intybus]|uniref:Uncharacterized protein n=1 Tax=Cichorium intybus TaxID=13427 RepID=A0ACB8ZQX0_CICIN|nr:hypothetical protein L2E82_44670 [Cichorium intybus]